MIDRGQLITDLAPHLNWKVAYKNVERYVREYLSEHPAEVIPTTELADYLLPPDAEGGRGAGIEARARLFKALAALAKHGLQHYTTKASEARTLYGKSYFPTYWRLPVHDSREGACPHCRRAYETLDNGSNI